MASTSLWGFLVFFCIITKWSLSVTHSMSKVSLFFIVLLIAGQYTAQREVVAMFLTWNGKEKWKISRHDSSPAFTRCPHRGPCQHLEASFTKWISISVCLMERCIVATCFKSMLAQFWPRYLKQWTHESKKLCSTPLAAMCSNCEMACPTAESAVSRSHHKDIAIQVWCSVISEIYQSMVKKKMHTSSVLELMKWQLWLVSSSPPCVHTHTPNHVHEG